VGDAQARAGGRLGLRDWKPTNMHVEVDGRVSAQLLELAAPRVLSEVHGAADVKIVVDGPADNPNISGRMGVTQPGIELEVRRYGRRLQLLDGNVQLSEHKLRIDSVHAKVDDGDLRLGGSMILDGTIQPDGTARLSASGVSSDAEDPRGLASQEAPYAYHVAARFQGSRGLGARIEGRVCHLSFTRQ